jgi:2-methylcitrate dehydratase PrpD
MRALVLLDRKEGLVYSSDGGSAAGSTVLARGLPRTNAAHAAFLNATAGTFLELDEGMRPTGHPGMHVVPAALAVAERGHRSGLELLRAVIVGYEVTARLFLAFRLRYPVHPHGHFGGVGAAVATALLDDVDPVAAAHAAGTTPLLPIWEACYEGATVRNTWTGLAAQTGVRAVDLVRAGLLGSAHNLELGYGKIAGDLIDPAAMSAPLNYDGLGITRDYFKIHSACALSHTAIDAVLELGLNDVSNVLDVHVETVANNLKLDRQPHPNELSGRFSLPYAVATALALGRSGPEAFTFRPEIAMLAQKVRVSAAEDLEASWPDHAPARVTVRTVDGILTRTVKNPRGHHSRPITVDDLQAKFDGLVGDSAGRWWPRLTNLSDVEDCAQLLVEAR